MKKTILVFLALFVIFSLGSCGGKKDDNSGKIVLKSVENLSQYVIVRGENCSKEITTLVTSLRKTINEVTDASVSIKTDIYNSQYEILVGETKRQQSTDAMANLRYYDYTIKKVGNKIVVAGGSDEAVTNAIELFKNQFIDSKNKTIKIPSGDGYTYIGNYAFDKMTVDGVDFGEFKLVNNSYYKDSVEFFRDLCGTSIIEHEGDMVDGEHYFILDGSELIEHKYSIKVENGNIIIKGSAHSIHAALEYFGNDIAKNESKIVELSSGLSYEGSTGKKEIYTKEQLAAVIQKVYDDPDQIIIGEQTKGLHETAIEDSIKKFTDATGEMPGIIGIDLGCYGFDLPVTTEMQWSAYICDMVDYAAEGGIITASAHWANPSENRDPNDGAKCRGRFGFDNSLEAYEQAFTDLITEGTEYNKFFKNELESNARFFKALEENGVPIIWRPLHEANGSWFWFCTGQGGHWLDADYLIDVWHYVYDYFENECGLTNLYWCYGPNWSANVKDIRGNTMSTTYLYPGDEYCDMVGVDWYSSGNMEITQEDNYLALTDLARKPGAITEFGPGGSILAESIEDQPSLYSSMDMYDDLCELTEDGYSFVYLLTWGDKWGIPAMSRGDELMQTDLCIGQAEVKAMFDALK